MYIAYEEFEKVMSQCHEVFTFWDDEYDKLQGLKRDIVKKKRDEHLRMQHIQVPAPARAAEDCDSKGPEADTGLAPARRSASPSRGSC